MTDEGKQKELQQRYLEMQLIDQQVKQLQKQIQNVDTQLVELSNTKANIDDLKKAKTGTEVLIPINPGIFFEGTIKNTNEFKVNVGADTVVSKSASETKGLIDEQIKELSKLRGQMIANLQEAILQAQVIQKDLEKLSE